MNIMQMRRGMGASGSPLPYDAEVQYIAADGNQCIDTNILGTQVYGVEYKFEPTDLNTAYQCYISNLQDNFTIGAAGNNIHRFYYRSRGVQITNPGNLGILPALFLSYNGVESLGQWNRTGGATPLGTSATNVHLLSQSGRGRRCKARIYYCKLYGENNVLVFDGIPVRLSGKGYLYDRITETLFGNAIDSPVYGDFTYGPDK
jgi:hypothetical protein